MARPRSTGSSRRSRGVEAWVTGIRREQSPDACGLAKLERDEKRGIWKLNPLVDWSNKDMWNYIFKHDLPYNSLHDHGYDSIGCAPCTLPGSGRDGRWAGGGQDRVRDPPVGDRANRDHDCPG